MKVLARILEQYSLNFNSYSRPHMTIELKEVCFELDSRCVAGWAVSDSIKKHLPIRALDMTAAFAIRFWAASSIRIVTANIVPKIIKRSCRPMAYVLR